MIPKVRIGQIPRNGLTWGCVCNSGGHIITYYKKIFLIDGLYFVIWYIDIIQ